MISFHYRIIFGFRVYVHHCLNAEDWAAGDFSSSPVFYLAGSRERVPRHVG